jgi:hypothetical protein
VTTNETGPDMPNDRRPSETPDERADRNFEELLQELRVAQTGVQILFAFLLTIPFQQRFTQAVGTGLRWEYVATLLATAISTALLIAPVSYHRILFRQGRKPHIVESSDKLAKAGLFFLAVAILGSMYLVIAVSSARDIAIWLVAAMALLFLITWVVIPVRMRRELRRTTDPD